MEVTLYSIYRERNRAHALALATTAEKVGWSIAMWALDSTVPELDRCTLGTGKGPKFAILKKLVALHPAPLGSAVVILDDDVEIDAEGLATWLAVSRQLGVDLSQPAHVRSSYWSHRITRRRPHLRARLTNFVEIGPAFMLLPTGRSLLDGLPDDMGWGLELSWWRRWRDEGLRMAVVDAAPMRHIAPPGIDYNLIDVRASTDADLRAEGFGRWQDLQRTLARWPRWRRSPPRAARPR